MNNIDLAQAAFETAQAERARIKTKLDASAMNPNSTSNEAHTALQQQYIAIQKECNRLYYAKQAARRGTITPIKVQAVAVADAPIAILPCGEKVWFTETEMVAGLSAGDFFIPKCYEKPVAKPSMTVDEKRARRLATTREKAKTLFADGYTCDTTKTFFVYEVKSPKGDCYCVDVMGGTCTCIQFSTDGDCKHLIATKAKVVDYIAFLTPKDAPRVPTNNFATALNTIESGRRVCALN